MTYKIVLSLIVLCFCAFAENINLTGTVTNALSGVAIAGALVKLENGGQTATTGADGSFMLAAGVAVVKGLQNQFQPHILSATINSGSLCINVGEKSVVDIITLNLQGKALSTVESSMDVGTHYITQPGLGAGVYLYKVISGNNQITIKGSSIGGVSGGNAMSLQSSSSIALAKQAKTTAAINDVIAVTKTGYLNYRVMVTNSDTSGIKIAMIVCAGTMTDNNGNVYQTVKIGNQVWTVENLRTTKYNDGTAIPFASGVMTSSGYCYYNFTTNADSINKFGAMYNWYTVATSKLAPTGWHVPTLAEWDTLQNYLIAKGYNWDGTTTGCKIAKSLAAMTDWWNWTKTDTGTIFNDLTKNNRSGFSALPGGYLSNNGGFNYIGMGGQWWTASEVGWNWASSPSLSVDNASLIWYDGGSAVKSCFFSVRLVSN